MGLALLTREEFRGLPLSAKKKHLRVLCREKGATKNHPLMFEVQKIPSLMSMLERELSEYPLLIPSFMQSIGPFVKSPRCYNNGKKLAYRQEFLWPRFANRPIDKVDFLTLSGPLATIEDGKVVPVINSEYEDYARRGGLVENYFSIEMDPTTYDMNKMGMQVLGHPLTVHGRWPEALGEFTHLLHRGNYIIAHFDATCSFHTLQEAVVATVRFLNRVATNGWELLVNTSLQQYGTGRMDMVPIYLGEMWELVQSMKWPKATLISKEPFRSETTASSVCKREHHMAGFILKSK